MIRKIITIIAILLSITCIFLGINSSIIPPLYLKTLIIIYLIIISTIIFLLKKTNKTLTIIHLTLNIITIIVSIIIITIFLKTDQIITKITKTEEISKYSVIVLKDSSYQTISDINNKKLGILDTFDNNYQKSLNKLKNKIDIHLTKYNNTLELANNLLSKNTDAILLDQNYISIIDEGINGFKNKIKVLNDITVKLPSNTSQTKELNMNKPFNIYISGIDTYGSINTISRSDVNIIATVNPNTSKILLTTIPRDMYLPLDGKNGLNDKLTHAGIYGINTSINTIENFLDTNIDYYIRINFNSLISLVDYIGGIDVYSDYSFDAGTRYYTKGMNYNLTGKDALEFSRNRYAFADGDRQRGRNQEKVIEAIINKVTTSKDINAYLNLINILEKSFQTNMTKNDIHEIITKQIENNYKWNITSIDINGYDHMDYTYSYPWQKLYVMQVDNNSLNKAKTEINNTLNEN